MAAPYDQVPSRWASSPTASAWRWSAMARSGWGQPVGEGFGESADDVLDADLVAADNHVVVLGLADATTVRADSVRVDVLSTCCGAEAAAGLQRVPGGVP
jgi:hypothetical protein